VHTCAKACLTSVAILIRITTRINHLLIGPLPTFPENCMQIRWEFLAQSCWQTDKQTNRQTNNDDYTSSLVELITATKQRVLYLHRAACSVNTRHRTLTERSVIAANVFLGLQLLQHGTAQHLRHCILTAIGVTRESSLEVAPTALSQSTRLVTG